MTQAPVRAERAVHAERAACAVRGPWECHLTVDSAGESVDALAAWAAYRGLSFVHIVLARGRTPSQPMLTLHGEGGPADRARATGALSSALAADGFRVLRVKTETAPWAEGVPRDDDEARRQPRTRYFEHHVKLLLPPDHDLAALTALAVPHGAHLSWNARRVRPDGRQERFVTQRCHGVGGVTAARRLAALLGTLEDAALEVVEVEREFVVYDSALGLDDGWIGEEHTEHPVAMGPTGEETV